MATSPAMEGSARTPTRGVETSWSVDAVTLLGIAHSALLKEASVSIRDAISWWLSCSPDKTEGSLVPSLWQADGAGCGSQHGSAQTVIPARLGTSTAITTRMESTFRTV